VITTTSSTLFKCNFPPYGKDFGGGNQPTGRFSNGLVPSDIIGTKIILARYNANLYIVDNAADIVIYIAVADRNLKPFIHRRKIRMNNFFHDS